MDQSELAARAQRAKRVTWVGFSVNVMLSVAKIVAGIVGRSGAMIADGVHSISDFVTDVIVIVFIGVSSKGEDTRFRYGHGKFETFATMLISAALLAVAIGLLWSSTEAIISAFSGATLPRPSMVALVMALVSILAKEWLFQYTRIAGEQMQSTALVANAWHHRSDALSSIAVFVGIGCAMFLGDSWRVLDPIAAAVVSVFIGLVAFRLGMPSVRELLEVSLPDGVTAEIGDVIGRVDGVCAYHHLRTRKNGNVYIMDFHIKVDSRLSIVEAHDISNRVEAELKTRYGQQSIVNIHIEPYQGEQVDSHKSCVD